VEVPDDDPVKERIGDRFEHATGPFATFEEALADIGRAPLGDYVILERGRIVWPQSAVNKYS
jgi:hypothetical protein